MFTFGVFGGRRECSGIPGKISDPRSSNVAIGLLYSLTYPRHLYWLPSALCDCLKITIHRVDVNPQFLLSSLTITAFYSPQGECASMLQPNETAHLLSRAPCSEDVTPPWDEAHGAVSLVTRPCSCHAPQSILGLFSSFRI